MFFFLSVLLRAGHRDRLDFGMDCGDVGFMRWYPHADTDTNSDAYPNTYPNTYPNAYPNANSDTNQFFARTHPGRLLAGFRQWCCGSNFGAGAGYLQFGRSRLRQCGCCG